MAPSRIDDDSLPSFSQISTADEPYNGPPRNVSNINALDFDKALQPKVYNMLGTHPESRILFTDVNILDSTGSDSYRGDVLIEGEKIAQVGVVRDVEALKHDPKVRVFHGRGRTLMSGLGDAHTHFTVRYTSKTFQLCCAFEGQEVVLSSSAERLHLILGKVY
jgi:adenine deaminase